MNENIDIPLKLSLVAQRGRLYTGTRVGEQRTWIARTGLTRSQTGRNLGRPARCIRVAICVSLRAHTTYIVNSHTFVPPFSPRVWTAARTPRIARYAATVNSRRITLTRNLRIREIAPASATRDINIEGYRMAARIRSSRVQTFRLALRLIVFLPRASNLELYLKHLVCACPTFVSISEIFKFANRHYNGLYFRI